ncbi:hatching enzyme 1.2-like [Daphnia pulicaria]|uniref:hatching enzyme 1.2-like n=1 Tax=Daphnia pulicaria TaxID=35523 RepID=UPI001EEB6305|nr:hatching enzyme 1.2-like [Daphnia pulicaria]
MINNMCVAELLGTHLSHISVLRASTTILGYLLYKRLFSILHSCYQAVDIMASNTVTFLVVATMTFLVFTSCLATSDPNLYVNNTQELETSENRAAAADTGKSLSLSDLVYGTSAASASNRQSDVSYLTEEDFRNALAVEDSSDVTNPNWIADHQHQSSNLFEGDIAGVKSARELRNAIIGVNFRWPDAVIPYVITSSYTPSDRSVIARAMMEYHNKTCIRFVPRTIQPDYIIIKTTGSGCNSNIGRTGGSQVVSLDQGCVHVSLIIHELMHAAGFFHEQSRTDRDDYVVINYGNIQAGSI